MANGIKDNDMKASSSETAELESMKKQLKEMLDLLETRIHREEQGCENDNENTMKNDWILAAAVLDRICAIAVTVIFIMGTATFLTFFFSH